MKHPHHELFEAIANRESADAFECHGKDWEGDHFDPAGAWIRFIAVDAENWTVRRKPKTIKIGEIDVPEPMRVAPAVGTHYWIVSVSEEFLYWSTWAGDKSDFYCLERGLCQSTKEAAELHRKALIRVSGGTP